MAREIPVGKHNVAIVDDEDFDLVSRYRWVRTRPQRSMTWYAMTHITASDGKKRGLYMHRLLMAPPPHLKIDHKNRNGLDNRRENLRLATSTQNSVNCLRRRTRAPYRGVYQHGLLWRAEIQVNGKTIRIGNFKTAEEAAHAYDLAALRHYGEFAVLNFLRPPGR